jgi:hypothetical protein
MMGCEEGPFARRPGRNEGDWRADVLLEEKSPRRGAESMTVVCDPSFEGDLEVCAGALPGVNLGDERPASDSGVLGRGRIAEPAASLLDVEADAEESEETELEGPVEALDGARACVRFTLNRDTFGLCLGLSGDWAVLEEEAIFSASGLAQYELEPAGPAPMTCAAIPE